VIEGTVSWHPFVDTENCSLHIMNVLQSRFHHSGTEVFS
jgi:hypothetical protein